MAVLRKLIGSFPKKLRDHALGIPPLLTSENVRSGLNSSWTLSRLRTLGSYQGRFVSGVMWQFHCLSWSSFCRFPLRYGWHVSIVESMHDLENASSLVGICTSSPRRFWRGQHRMMKGDWTCGA